MELTDQLTDPVEVLFGVQLGGGIDINSAFAYCEKQIENPTKTHLVLVTDLYEGGDVASMLGRARRYQAEQRELHRAPRALGFRPPRL